MKVKKVQKKKYKAQEVSFIKHNNEIFGILIVAFGIMTLLSFYIENSIGTFGIFIKDFLLGLMGYPAFITPPIIIVYGIFVLLKKNDSKFNLRLLYLTILLIFFSAFFQVGFFKPKDYENMEVLKSIPKFFEDGKNLRGGGILGGLISVPFLLTFQVLGTIIILTTLSLIDIMLLTNISIVRSIGNIKELLTSKFNTAFKSYKQHKDDISTKNNPNSVTDADHSGRESGSETKPKVIDFNKQKATRESKEKAIKVAPDESIGYAKSEPDTETKEVREIPVEPIQFIMKDIKKSVSVKQNSSVEPLDIQTSLQDRHDIEYRYPEFDLLSQNTEDGTNIQSLRNAAIEGAVKLEETLKSFGVEAKVVNVSRGPAVTRYELQPSPGVKVSKIVNLSDDISLNLATAGVRIEAPIPGKAAIGIEVPNKEVTAVFLRDVIESHEFAKHPSKIAFAVGKDISGENVVADIGKMPHMLIAGATGAGKSVCINSLIVSLLYKASPDEVKLLMVDPKVVELGIYNGIPHLLIPVVTDPRKAAGALNWAVQEMVNRYKLFAEKGVRDIKGYNAMLKEKGEAGSLPHIVIIIDELADLMMVAPNDVEDAICRLAQMARAAGMHLVIATQRPSVDVITGVIKANIPSRISFAVSSQVDSRTILDMAGAEKLLGKGDMLFYPIGEQKPIRVKGCFVSDKEVEKVVEFIKSQGDTQYDANIIEEINSEKETEESNPGDNDELLNQAIDLVVEAGQASVSLIQRKFKVGYARAARIVDQMEARGIVGRFEGSKPRQVLITKQQWQELQMANGQ
ncbi:MAG: DNA translocase FtsK [Clostridia bacterium]|nr:DNA translocase FtsK [Clostridia bacterium]